MQSSGAGFVHQYGFVPVFAWRRFIFMTCDPETMKVVGAIMMLTAMAVLIPGMMFIVFVMCRDESEWRKYKRRKL